MIPDTLLARYSGPHPVSFDLRRGVTQQCAQPQGQDRPQRPDRQDDPYGRKEGTTENDTAYHE